MNKKNIILIIVIAFVILSSATITPIMMNLDKSYIPNEVYQLYFGFLAKISIPYFDYHYEAENSFSYIRKGFGKYQLIGTLQQIGHSSNNAKVVMNFEKGKLISVICEKEAYDFALLEYGDFEYSKEKSDAVFEEFNLNAKNGERVYQAALRFNVPISPEQLLNGELFRSLFNGGAALNLHTDATSLMAIAMGVTRNNTKHSNVFVMDTSPYLSDFVNIAIGSGKITETGLSGYLAGNRVQSLIGGNNETLEDKGTEVYWAPKYAFDDILYRFSRPDLQEVSNMILCAIWGKSVSDLDSTNAYLRGQKMDFDAEFCKGFYLSAHKETILKVLENEKITLIKYQEV